MLAVAVQHGARAQAGGDVLDVQRCIFSADTKQRSCLLMNAEDLLTRVATASASAGVSEVISQSACIPPAASINYEALFNFWSKSFRSGVT